MQIRNKGVEATLAGLVASMSELAFAVLSFYLVRELDTKQAQWAEGDLGKPTLEWLTSMSLSDMSRMAFIDFTYLLFLT